MKKQKPPFSPNFVRGNGTRRNYGVRNGHLNAKGIESTLLCGIKPQVGWQQLKHDFTNKTCPNLLVDKAIPLQCTVHSDGSKRYSNKPQKSTRY